MSHEQEPESTTPEARVLALLAESVRPQPRGRPGLGRLVRRLIDRATLTSRHRQYHVDVALLQAIHELERRRTVDVDGMRNEVRAAVDGLDVVAARFDDVEARAAVAAALADEIARNVHAATEELGQTMSDVSEQVSGQRTDLTQTRDELRRTATELTRATAQLSREIAGLRAGAVKAEFLFDEVTSRPFVSDESTLLMTDAEGRETLGFRNGPGPRPLYAGFEALFRGPTEMVRNRQRPYVAVLRGSAPVVDLACGRGELLELLAGTGVEARGVDLDPDMVEECRARGLDVELGDAVEWLEKHADGSLGAVFSAQFVEHISGGDLVRLLRVALEKLRPGGIFVAETVNPHSPRALKSFWVDPTHVHPVFPETLVALSRLTGYGEATTMFPAGTHDLAENLRMQGEYAVVARAPA